VHSEQLKLINQQADQAGRTGDLFAAIQHWRKALELLPASSRQYTAISSRIDELSRQADMSKMPLPPSSATPADATHHSGKQWAKSLGAAGAIALLAWKFKFVVVLLLSKAKLLLFGLTKLSTLFSMLASLGVYWTQWGWKFALGLVLSIYIHEMGHVAALRACGIRAGAPMFIPGFGAFVRLKQMPLNAREDARIGLAGPIWGTFAALGCWGIGTAMHWPAWIAIAHVAAWINLFNLLPVWQLDGSRGFRALDRTWRILTVILVAVLWQWTGEGLLVLILIIAGFRAFAEPGPEQADRMAAFQFALLLVVLSVVCLYSPRFF
jgi:Zn-dependent protease